MCVCGGGGFGCFGFFSFGMFFCMFDCLIVSYVGSLVVCLDGFLVVSCWLSCQLGIH